MPWELPFLVAGMADLSMAKLGDGGELTLGPPYQATVGGGGEPQPTKGVCIGMVMASVRAMMTLTTRSLGSDEGEPPPSSSWHLVLAWMMKGCHGSRWWGNVTEGRWSSD